MLELELFLRKRNSGELTWTTKSGKVIAIKDMTTQHLINTIKVLGKGHTVSAKVTSKMVSAVHFVEHVLDIPFEGDIEDFDEVSDFPSLHLEDAKWEYEGLKCEYEAYIADLD